MKQMKISMKVLIIIFAILLVTVLGLVIYIKKNKKVNENNEQQISERMSENISKTDINKSEDDLEYNELDDIYRIKGDDYTLLYRNEYESDTSYSEKIFYLDEESKENMKSKFDVLDAGEVLNIGAFDGEFIRVRFDQDVDEYEISLAYMQQEEFYNCATNKFIKKAFDKDGNEIKMPKLDFTRNKLNVPSELSYIYALFDITTDEGEEYIIGMYDEVLPENNSNIVLITTVLKKENAEIDIYNEKQVKEFWEQYANYQVEENSRANKSEDRKDYEEITINGETYYHRLTSKKWKGKYHQDDYHTASPNNKEEVVSYDDYISYIDELNSSSDKKIKNYYKNEDLNYIILSYSNGHSWCEMELIDCLEEDNQIIIYGDEDISGVMGSGSGFLIVIPTNMPVGTPIQYRECYSTNEISNLENYGTTQTQINIEKPIIYLYPTEETNLSVKLLKEKNITCSYPRYKKEWNVLAKTNGDLIDLKTNRKLYSLYYESESEIDFKVEDEGFVVKGEDTIKFLEEKLAILGLNEKESEEFIVYWLPKLESNKYNYIRFATIDEINENMPLEINPSPDSIIRVLMTYKGLDKPIEVKEQKLFVPDRTGFVAIEWGGTEIK